MALWCVTSNLNLILRGYSNHMSQRSFNSNPAPSHSKASAPQDSLARVFNAALVSTQIGTKRDFAAELHELMESTSFKAILTAIRHLSRIQNLTERQAAEQVLQTFRKMDALWGDYVFREGVDRLRGNKQR